jgi:hypothetical protein
MPKINREKLLEYLQTEYAEELDLSDILRSCEVELNEERYVSEILRKKKDKR